MPIGATVDENELRTADKALKPTLEAFMKIRYVSDIQDLAPYQRPESIKRIFNWTDRQTGMTARITKIDEEWDGHICITGNVYSPDGQNIGKFTRELTPDACHNQKFYLRPAWRNKGFAKRWMPGVIRRLTSFGCHEVTVSASWMNGPYTWAKLGFCMIDQESPWYGSEKRQVESYLERALNTGLPQNLYNKAHEILEQEWYEKPLKDIARLGQTSAWRDSHNNHLGKGMLLYADWEGSIRLGAAV